MPSEVRREAQDCHRSTGRKGFKEEGVSWSNATEKERHRQDENSPRQVTSSISDLDKKLFKGEMGTKPDWREQMRHWEVGR